MSGVSKLGVVLVSLVIATGCKEDPVIPIANMDGSIRRDVGMDSESDVEEADGDVRDIDTPDRVVFDTSIDIGPPPPPSELEVCTDEAPEPTCGACAAGTVCADELCGGQSCVPGRRCTDSGDCGGRACTAGHCEPSSGACTSSRECPLGFQCESDACVDRRIPCDFRTSRCPRGMYCGFAGSGVFSTCLPAGVPCESDSECEVGTSCLELADGQRACLPAGNCTSHDDCDAGTSCGIDPATAQAWCTPDGLCRDGTCPTGYECLDVGFGPRCVAEGGTCTSNADCDARAVCGSVEADDPPRCLTYDEES